MWGSNPANPDNLCGQKILAFGADRTELLPASGVACGLPPELIWSPANPTGERCGTFDFMRSVFGVTITPDAPNGKGRSATDNVGVQYGLKALLAGEIIPEQFVDLNEKIGGIDIDGNFVAQRKAADPEALEILYKTGRMNSGSGAEDIPEIDNRTGFQMDDTGFHPAFESFSYRARLDRSNGHHDNQVIWLSRPGSVVPSQFDYMRAWLDALAADTSHAPRGGQGPSREARRPRRHMLHGGRSPRRPHLQRHLALLRRAADRRGRPTDAGRNEVPDEAAVAGGLRHGRLHRGPVGTTTGDLPDRSVRLQSPGRLAAPAEGALAHLRGWARWAAAGRRAAIAGARGVLRELASILDGFAADRKTDAKLASCSRMRNDTSRSVTSARHARPWLGS